MSDAPKIETLPTLPEGVSAVRFMIADAGGVEYRHCRSLSEARASANATLVMEGDYGGQIYLTCPVRHIQCDEAALRQLLEDVDALSWGDPDGTGLFFEMLPVGSGVAGGMRGGLVADGVWLHPWFGGNELPTAMPRQRLLDEIESVLRGERASISHGEERYRRPAREK